MLNSMATWNRPSLHTPGIPAELTRGGGRPAGFDIKQHRLHISNPDFVDKYHDERGKLSDAKRRTAADRTRQISSLGFSVEINNFILCSGAAVQYNKCCTGALLFLQKGGFIDEEKMPPVPNEITPWRQKQRRRRLGEVLPQSFWSWLFVYMCPHCLEIKNRPKIPK